VEAAVSERWSNGPVEDNLTDSKCSSDKCMGVPVSNCSTLAYYPSQRLVTHNIAPKLRQNRFNCKNMTSKCASLRFTCNRHLVIKEINDAGVVTSYPGNDFDFCD